MPFFSCNQDLEQSKLLSINPNPNPFLNIIAINNPFPVQEHNMINKSNLDLNYDHGEHYELIFELKKLGIEEEEAQQYFSAIMDIGKIIKSTGGFYNPVSKNAQQLTINGNSKYYKIIINGSSIEENYSSDIHENYSSDIHENYSSDIHEILHFSDKENIIPEWNHFRENNDEKHNYLKIAKYISNQYRVTEISNNMENTNFSDIEIKAKILKSIYNQKKAKKMIKSLKKFRYNDYENEKKGKMTFHIHNYDTYRKHSHSPMVDGSLISVKMHGEDITTVRGTLRVDLNSRVYPPFFIYFGSENSGSGGIVLDKNDFAQSGKLLIKYAYTKLGKEYIIDGNLSDQDKAELRKLNLFNIA